MHSTLDTRQRALLTQEIARLSAEGWRIISQTETSAQLIRPRRLSVGLLLLAAAPVGLGLLAYWPLVWLGAALLLLVTIDFLMKKDEIRFVTGDQLLAQVDARPRVVVEGLGQFRCSACRASVTHDARQCPQCGAAFA